MWAEYGDKSPTSIAIQTTVGDLIESLESDEHNIHIGKVEYKDYLTEDIEGYEDFPSINLNDPDKVLKLFYAPFLHKRDVYQDEHEVRAKFHLRMSVKNFWGVSTHLKYHFIVTRCLGLMPHYCEITEIQ